MRRRFVWRWLVVAGVLAAALAVAGAVAILRGSGSAEAAPASKEELPTALAGHIDKLKQSLPGLAGMSKEGPGTAADAEFSERAYPDTTISVAEMEGARDAFAAIVGPAGSGDGGRWRMIGPSRALYPFTEFRNSGNYVPNEYVAGGRTTAIALENNCRSSRCKAWITPAGGGIWRTNNIFARNVRWDYLAGPLGINAAGAVTVDPNDPDSDTIYVGTGEANICGSGCVAGTGVYKSTNGGRTWRILGGTDTDTGNPLGGKGIGEIVIKPGDSNTIYVGTTTALRGMSSVCCTGVTRPVPGAGKWGLYKSTDGGATWNFIHNGSVNAADCTGSLAEFGNAATCSPRGVRHVKLDPSNSNIVYAGSYARGIWRSNDAGATWTQIKPSLNPAIIQTRPSFDVTKLPNGNTRMYVYEGNIGAPYARLFRSDDVATGAPAFEDMTGNHVSSPRWAWFNLCTGQCWYDVFVYTPKGHPDVVYAGGSYLYGENIANKRGIILSTNAGESGTDMTFDGTDPVHPNGYHPDQHDFVTNPSNPFQFVETNDGGVMRSSGDFVDRSSWCDSRTFVDDEDPPPPEGATAEQKRERCKQMLSRVPSKLEGINDGLNTLQFQSLSVSPHNSRIVQGGTQDNGTWETQGSRVTWKNTMIGDGGQSGFDVAMPNFRFHNFFDVTTEVNFDSGDIGDWIWVADRLFAHGGSQFYAPVISDPRNSKWLFAGTARTAYRTKTHGLGTMTMAEAQQHCNTWTGDFAPGITCGDFAELASDQNHWLTYGPNVGCYGSTPGVACPPPYPYGTDRSGGAVSANERVATDSNTMWAATTTGRVFVSKNVDAEPVEPQPPLPNTNDAFYPRLAAVNVSWTRIDDDATTPNRFISSIHIDPANPNHAWISYSGYNANTPAAPGHVFEVTFNPATGTSTWVNRDYNLADLPVTDLVRDDRTGDLYAASDFGVVKLRNGSTTWRLAARGMPNVEITGLTIVSKERKLFAASHGLSAWLLELDDDDGDDNDDD
jgi:hypothetical protein